MKTKFKSRSRQNELLDAPDNDYQLVAGNLREIDFLNRFTGGHYVSRLGIKEWITDKNRVYHIIDIGCGSGDWMLYIARWARRNNFGLRLTGVDKNKHAIRMLNLKCKNDPSIKGITSDYNILSDLEPADIYHCGLFCHHLSDPEVIQLFRQMAKFAKIGFIINDLHRTPLAYYSAKITTTVLGGSRFSRHDGPVSVLRGFKEYELKTLLNEAGISSFKISKFPFFRFLVIVRSFNSL